uniref:Alpha-amylase/subtilisin inhibitor n=1 Tax=Lygus hesperus TaxID=30085 RepID=A0A0A9YJB8_LYGHE
MALLMSCMRVEKPVQQQQQQQLTSNGKNSVLPGQPGSAVGLAATSFADRYNNTTIDSPTSNHDSSTSALCDGLDGEDEMTAHAVVSPAPQALYFAAQELENSELEYLKSLAPNS